MSRVQITSVGNIANNPCPISEGFHLKVSFYCFQPLNTDLEFKLMYSYCNPVTNNVEEQELDNMFVGQVNVGPNQFVLQTNPPDYNQIHVTELLDTSVLLLSCCYVSQEFATVGFYVRNGYLEEQGSERASDSNGTDNNNNNESHNTNSMNEQINSDEQETPVSYIAPIQMDKLQRFIADKKPRYTVKNIVWDCVENLTDISSLIYQMEPRDQQQAMLLSEIDESELNNDNRHHG